MSLPQLRPMGFGEILDGAFTLYRRHFLTLFVTALLYSIPLALVAAAWMVSTATETPNFGAFGLMMLFGIFTLAGMGALTHQVSEGFTGGEVGVRSGYARGLRRVLSLIGVMILSYIAMIAPVALLGIVAAVVVPQASGAGVVGVLLMIVAFLVGIWAFLMVLAGLFAVMSASVIEGSGPWTSLRRSWQLSKGARARILGVLIVSWLIAFLPMLGVMVVTGMGATMFDPEAMYGMSTGQIYLQQAIGMLSGALTFPFFMGAIVLTYYDRRIRLEGYDIEVAAEALVPAN